MINTDVIIIGGGISGLSLAYYLQKEGIDYKLFEIQNSFGGKLQSDVINDKVIEWGPQTLRRQNTNDRTIQLIEELDLPIENVDNEKYIYINDTMYQVPINFYTFLTSFLTRYICIYIFLDLLCIFNYTSYENETVHSFFSRHFGNRIRDIIIKPMIHGIYSGDINKLLIKAVFPKLYYYDKKYGSVCIGYVFENFKNFFKKSKSSTKPYKLKNGMCSLIQSLVDTCSNNIYSNTTIDTLDILSDNKKIRITTHNKEEYVCNNIVFTTPNVNVIKFPKINNAAIYVANVFYDNTLYTKTKGYGYLMANVDTHGLLGCLFTKPGVLTLLFRNYINDENELKKSIKYILLKHLAMNVNDSDIYIKLWENAIPQYDLLWNSFMKEIEFQNNIHYIGDYMGKLGINNRINDSYELVQNKLKNNNEVFILANFGGPRDLNEISPFLQSLLGDQDVLTTKLPSYLHKLLFGTIAKIRARSKKSEYESIGGKSPIYETTEKMAAILRSKGLNVITFHRYNSSEHSQIFQKLNNMQIKQLKIFTLFPQFSYATVGSIARIFQENLSSNLLQNTKISKSYFNNTYYIDCFTKIIQNKINSIDGDTFIIFSAHGLPQKFIDNGDSYKQECIDSSELIMQNIQCEYLVCFQSRFGYAKWIQPYTEIICQNIDKYIKKQKNIVFVPIAFTMDHLETLYEIEQDYMTILQEKQYNVFRVDTLNLDSKWLNDLPNIINDPNIYVDLKECLRPCW